MSSNTEVKQAQARLSSIARGRPIKLNVPLKRLELQLLRTRTESSNGSRSSRPRRRPRLSPRPSIRAARPPTRTRTLKRRPGLLAGNEPPGALAPAGAGAIPGLHQRAIFSGKIIVPRCLMA